MRYKEVIEHKGFFIENNCTGRDLGRVAIREYTIYDKNGVFLRNCKTIKECKERIDTQTI